MRTAGTIVETNEDICIVKIKRGSSQELLPENLSIGPPKPIDSKVIRSAIYRNADHMLEAPSTLHVTTELLARNVPRIQGKQIGEAVITSDNLQRDSLAAIAALENSYLIIQGPPGTRKNLYH